MNAILPLGSVVVLRDGVKPLMIIGRNQMFKGTDTMYDYIACLYPEGNIDAEHTYLFNHTDIDTLLFEGYSDELFEQYLSLVSAVSGR